MTEADVFSELTAIFNEVFMRDDIVLGSSTTAKNIVGWDSFKQIEILLALEARYHLKFTTRELDTLQCVGDLVAIVLARGN